MEIRGGVDAMAIIFVNEQRAGSCESALRTCVVGNLAQVAKKGSNTVRVMVLPALEAAEAARDRYDHPIPSMMVRSSISIYLSLFVFCIKYSVFFKVSSLFV